MPMPVQQPPSGLESILAALATGGQPVGQMGKEASPIAPPAPVGNLQGAPVGAVNPIQQALASMDPAALQQLLAALQSGGFNQPPQVGGLTANG